MASILFPILCAADCVFGILYAWFQFNWPEKINNNVIIFSSIASSSIKNNKTPKEKHEQLS